MAARYVSRKLKPSNVMSALSACIVGLVAVQAFGQNEPPPAAFAEQIEVRALAIEVVVADRDGQRVQGLNKEDFTLLIDGEPADIEHFAEVRGGDYMQTVAAYPSVQAGAPSGTSLLIFIDEFFAIPTDRDSVLRALKERVPNLRADDQVAILAWDGAELAVLTGWTSSKDDITAALDAAMARSAQGLRRQTEQRQFSATMNPVDIASTRSMDPSADRWHLGTQERQYADLLVSQLQGTVGATTAALRAFETPPGRKVALVMAGGWPMEVDQYIARDPSRSVNDRRIPSGTELYAPIITTANLLGYTVYGVDMPGLMSRTGADASLSASTAGTGLGFAESVREGELHNSLHYISVETGGMPLLNGQRITSLSEVGRDVGNFYWLSFSPSWERDDRSHDIAVEVSDPKLGVRHRAEYTDMSVQTQLAMAVRSSLLYGPFGVSDDLKVEVVEAEKAAKKRFDVTIKVTVPMDKLTVVETDKGYLAQAMLFMAAIDPSGGRSDIPSVPLAIVAPVMPKAGDSVDYETTVQLHSKTSRLTVALLDVVSGETLVTTITKDAK